MNYFGLVVGKLISESAFCFGNVQLNETDVHDPIVITADGSTVIIEKETKQAVSGTYLVDMDGLMSLNEIQRLPGRQLAIAFNGSTLTVDKASVEIVGNVVIEVRKG
ncbi:hypothetical protein [Vibrio sp. 99-8-1]|uniref:hypothetical protein n=1 Tax=Vibrio sp. 99-8-1 TaxID=2607602 RepID=UPI0014934D16|nr:hypothetical protein [Vibrio sp. 99-8-1]NOI65990.1 hypothetical protein [Vibrio sp. 99-8-1]